MTAKDNDERNGCTFHWTIENISHCWLKKGERIESPVFTVDALEDTKWSLWLYPFGDTNQDNAIFYLSREKDSGGPSCLQINYQLALINKDGSFSSEKTLCGIAFLKDYRWPCHNYETIRKFFVTEKEGILPKVTLTVQCSIWKINQKIIKPKHLSARTVFQLNRKSFIWKIDDFSTLRPGIRSNFKDELIEFDLVMNGVIHFVKKLDLDVISFNESIKYFFFNVSIVSTEGTTENCGELEYFAGDLKKGLLPIPLFSKMLLENKTRYLSNDVLSLDFEFVSSNGTPLHEVNSFGAISTKLTNIVEKEEPQSISVLGNDLKSAFNDRMFSDMELRTSTQSFRAHKFILSARSPVFNRMFSNDMKEKNSGCVNIVDLEDDTVHRMLTYIYTDTLDDLLFENACKLYSAADKYEILSLKNRCSSVLKSSLCQTNVCNALTLADQHQDDDLKRAVEEFILMHDKEIFGSQEWRHFMASNSEIAADIMYRKMFPG